jgi:hypothetical protein
MYVETGKCSEELENKGCFDNIQVVERNYMVALLVVPYQMDFFIITYTR